MQPAVEFDLLKVGHCTHPECIVMRGGRKSPIEFPSLAGLIRHSERGLMLYDTGYSPKFFEATRSFPECLYRKVTPPRLPADEELLFQLGQRNIRPEEIRTIVISHFHADHVAGLRDFPKAEFIATSGEYHEVKRKGRIGRLRRAFLQDLLPADFEERVVFADTLATVPADLGGFEAGYDLLGDQSLIGIALPGHARSQLGVVMNAQGRRTFLVGDACWKIEGLERRKLPAWIAFRLFADARRYRETFARLADLYEATGSLVIIPSHCTTSWGRYGNSRNIVND
jgi:glyoxylase-like metal-dependent hydrolase (beta-lactamase superfamily II)